MAGGEVSDLLHEEGFSDLSVTTTEEKTCVDSAAGEGEPGLPGHPPVLPGLWDGDSADRKGNRTHCTLHSKDPGLGLCGSPEAALKSWPESWEAGALELASAQDTEQPWPETTQSAAEGI